jgi:hypothetical protein
MVNNQQIQPKDQEAGQGCDVKFDSIQQHSPKQSTRFVPVESRRFPSYFPTYEVCNQQGRDNARRGIERYECYQALAQKHERQQRVDQNERLPKQIKQVETINASCGQEYVQSQQIDKLEGNRHGSQAQEFRWHRTE